VNVSDNQPYPSRLPAVIEQLKDLIADPGKKLPKEKLIEWMQSPDIEVLGAVARVIMRGDLAARIFPEPSVAERQSLLLKYWERCILENPQGCEFASDRYIAGADVVNWFGSLWRDSRVPRKLFVEMKNWLADLYARGSGEVRTCIIQASLEHLFEQKEIRHFFGDWEEDPVLKRAFEEASGWSKAGGRSPLAKPRFQKRLE